MYYVSLKKNVWSLSLQTDKLSTPDQDKNLAETNVCYGVSN